MFPIRTILHPTDFSPAAELAFQLACSLARDHKARLIVMHVAGPAHASLYQGAPVILQLEQHDREISEQLHKLKPGGEDVAIEYRMTKGVAADEIIRLAQETACDLIVMGTHGRTGLSRVLVGSVAEQIMRSAPCPVLAVKAPAQLNSGPQNA